MQETHIPEVLATGKFQSAKFVRVLVDEEMGGKTYAVQFAANSWEILQQYYSEDAPRLREESKKLFIALSLMKGTTDVIEGSSINLNSVVGMDLQVGDIIQPIYDVINTLWKISFASVVILKIETLYYEVFKVKIANILMITALLTYFPSL